MATAKALISMSTCHLSHRHGRPCYVENAKHQKSKPLSGTRFRPEAKAKAIARLRLQFTDGGGGSSRRRSWVKDKFVGTWMTIMWWRGLGRGGGEENGLKDTSAIISAESRNADEGEVMLGASEGVVALL